MDNLKKPLKLYISIFILLINCYALEGNCIDLLFNLQQQGSRLVGYVFKELQAKYVAECAYYCFNELPECKSFNFEKESKITAKIQRKCELNNATKSSYLTGFIVIDNFDYWESKTITENYTSKSSGNSQKKHATSCAALYKSGITNDGLYSIDPDGQGSFVVLCDMMSDGGGWTILQRRFNGSVDFNTYWINYTLGFGAFEGEFWLGLGKIHRLTSIESNTLKIDLKSFSGEYKYATYTPFAVADDKNGYMLTAKNYVGSAGDSLYRHDGMMFTTRDVDNDKRSWQNCAKAFKGGWWFKDCHSSNLNGYYHHGHYSTNEGDRDGVVWETWKGLQESLKETVMKIRPSDF